MRSELKDLVGMPLDFALEQAALFDCFPKVVQTVSQSRREDQGERSPFVIAVREDAFLVGHFLTGIPEDSHG